MRRLIDALARQGGLSREEWVALLRAPREDLAPYARTLARQAADAVYGREVYLRGLFEFTNYCKNDCLYCGIRAGNSQAQRYRLSGEEILSCCRQGYALGLRTFVLQGGEDPYFTRERMVGLIRAIKDSYPDCAVTISIGERPREDYQAFFDAGADRYLLRHETADAAHYRLLHPPSMSHAHRLACLRDLKEIGFQVGSGFMVGAPGQSVETLAEDFLFLQQLRPHMVGIGPFIPHRDTPFGGRPGGSVEDTLFYLSLIRLMLPCALLPATTALNSLDPEGREKGIACGANVIMPNLSPKNVREKYQLYNNKAHSGCEAAEHLKDLKRKLHAIGYQLAVSRGDYRERKKEL